jgi:hypothetical protein
MKETLYVGDFGKIIENLFLIALKKGNMNFYFTVKNLPSLRI